MTPEITITNMPEFQAVMAEAIKHSSRALPVVLNGHAIGIASKAIKMTKRADPSKIEWELGVVGHELRKRKSGKLSISRKGKLQKGRVILHEKQSLAYRLQARYDALSGKKYSTEVRLKRARNLINRRKKAVGFIASGWIYALRELNLKIKGKARGGKVPGWSKRSKGGAEAAKTDKNLRSEASIWSTSLNVERGNPMPTAVAGLNAALAGETESMVQHLRERYGVIFRRFSAK